MNQRERERPIESVAEFAETIDERFLGDWVFRGQAAADWELVPSIFRPEVLAIEEPQAREACEREMLAQFKRDARPYLEDLPGEDEDWRWLAIAQHYKMPTRLLDWTENAIAALFFAVEESNGGAASAVWCARLTRSVPEGHRQPFHIDGIYKYYPPRIARRITAQRACFTAHPSHYTAAAFEWPGPLEKLVIPGGARDRIRHGLRVLGIDRASLFPDLEGIALEIRRKYCTYR